MFKKTQKNVESVVFCFFMVLFSSFLCNFAADLTIPLTIQKTEMEQRYSSELFERAVDEFSKLPGVGRKSALRLVLHLLRMDVGAVDGFADAVSRLRHNVNYCRVCHNISDDEVCQICASPSRDGTMICVVENIRDVMAIEATNQYHGLYHVLGGVISPLDGIGPADLEIQSLVDRVAQGGIAEVILALSSTMEGDTTDFYISRKLSQYVDTRLTVLARGLSVNDELQYTDEVTLGRSIVNRVEFRGGN